MARTVASFASIIWRTCLNSEQLLEGSEHSVGRSVEDLNDWSVTRTAVMNPLTVSGRKTYSTKAEDDAGACKLC